MYSEMDDPEPELVELRDDGDDNGEVEVRADDEVELSSNRLPQPQADTGAASLKSPSRLATSSAADRRSQCFSVNTGASEKAQ